MAFFTLSALLLAISLLSSGVSGGTWCVCKEGSDAALQKALDYACGAGADCTQLRQGGACYQPNSLRAHCSYAVNSYYLKNHPSGATCDFSGAATLSGTDPSSNGCAYPASSGSGTSTTTTPTPVTTTPTSGTTPTTSTTPTTTVTPTTGTTTTTTSPYSSTPAGGFSTGLAPTSTNTDYSHGGLHIRGTLSFLIVGLVLPLLNN